MGRSDDSDPGGDGTADGSGADDSGGDDDRVRAHVHVSGKVQGVYYRASTRERAREVGVDGWVRNLEDGRVEAVFEGTERQVQAMLDWCHRGSEAARVEDVAADFGDPQGESGFEVRW